jgi:hypothetical protein
MERKMQRWLRDMNHLYTPDDIMEEIEKGTLQSHTFGNTWVITAVHEWPRRKSVHIDLVVGTLEDAIAAEPQVCAWARSIGADLITGSGRPGWNFYRDYVDGWRMNGYQYSKDLRNV